jgi:carboxyl-terminal processing protease
LRAAGIEKALAGNFSQGFKLIGQAASLAPKDERAAAARALLDDYLERLAGSETQRADEYKEAVARVERCLLAQEYLPKLAAAKLEEKLREKIKAVVAAYNVAGSDVRSAQAAEKDAAELGAQAARNRKRAAALRHEAAPLEAMLSGLALVEQYQPLLCAIESGPVRTWQIVLAIREPVRRSYSSKLAERTDEIAELERESEEALDKAASLRRQAAENKSESLHKLDEAAAGLKEAGAVLKEESSDYAKIFRELSASAARALSEFRTAWAESEATDAEDLRRRVDALKPKDEKLAAAMGDVAAMIDEQPWKKALVQARIALELADTVEEPRRQGWYRSLVDIAKSRGGAAIAEARWYDALDAYVGLHELEKENEDYLNKVKTVRKHVRVLGLYGRQAAGEDSPEAGNGPEGSESKPPDQGEETWREFVRGVDAEMVRSAISRLDLSYVTTVDYRRIGRAALSSLKILAETPQAANSFEALAEEEKKREFLDAIASQLDAIEKRDRVDHVDLLLALNVVLRASERFVDIPPEVVAVEFTEGMLSELDKFSTMIWPHDVPDFNKLTMGRFHGVGIKITKEAGEPLKVVTPLADSPALRAGIRAGDMIIAVDGTPTKNLPINRLVSMIMGQEGSKVVLTAERPGRPAPIDFEVIREKIDIKTVKGWRRERGGKWRYLMDPEGAIGYIQLTQFTRGTPSEVAEAIAEVEKELAEANKGKLESLVLDLRFNPGGLLDSAAGVANQFLRSGKIVDTRGLHKRPVDHRADEKGGYLRGDLVVLVNEHSASASEIVSGAIKDWKRGIIVGGRTYGKGSVQNVIPVRRERALLKLTTAYYYLPSGRLLHRENGKKQWGVDPDIKVKFTPKQTKRWLEIRRKTGLLLTDHVPKTLDKDLKEQYEEDIQLQTAVLLLKLMKLQDAKPAA